MHLSHDRKLICHLQDFDKKIKSKSLLSDSLKYALLSSYTIIVSNYDQQTSVDYRSTLSFWASNKS